MKCLSFLGFPNYYIDESGQAWSKCSGMLKPLKLRTDRKGYKRVYLCHLGKMKQFKIHFLVLSAFVGPRPEGMEARHFPDKSKSNNNVSNLRWGTRSDNQRDKEVQGGVARLTGERNGQAKLTRSDVAVIRSLKDTVTKRELAGRFGVCLATIFRAIHGHSWK